MAYSPILTETHDFFCGITNSIGEIVAINVDVPFHMFACIDAVKAVINTYGDDIHSGDQFFLNDPWQHGAHLNDTTLLMPIFSGGKLRMWIAAGAHYGDVGGTVPGSASGECTEIFHEGIRVPAVRVKSNGVLNEEFLRILLANVRQPFEMKGVFLAQSTTTEMASARVLELYERYSAETVDGSIEVLLTRAEMEARQAISLLPDGEYFYEDYLENGGPNWPQPVVVRCSMTVKGDHLIFDFEGTSPQINGVANCAMTNTWAAIFDVVDTYLAPGYVSNFGAARAFEVRAPEGSVVNSKFPVPINGFATVMFGPIHGCIQGLLAQIMPEKVSGLTTSSANQTNIAGFGGRFREDEYWLVYEFPCGGWGATSANDGSLNVYQWHIGDIPVIWPLERLENMNPIRALSNEIYLDSGGPGFRRGGAGIKRAWEVTSDATFSVLGTDAVLPRPGMCGGYAGALNWIGIIRDGQPLKSSALPLKAGGVQLKKHDILLYLVAGGGGYGDPLDREPERVAEDVRDGYVSINGAFSDYGVVIDNNRVDDKLTKSSRDKIRASRVHPQIFDEPEDLVDKYGARTIRVGTEIANLLGAVNGELVEFTNYSGPHLRGWVLIDEQLPSMAAAVGPRGKSILKSKNGLFEIRKPLSYCMLNQDADILYSAPMSVLT
jgi:N-methylhydantoinase B